MEVNRYYSRLVMVGRRNTPIMREASTDLLRAFQATFVPFA
jgi:hypothetical protein